MTLDDIPFVAFGSDELAAKPKIEVGAVIPCQVCQTECTVTDSEPPMLQFIKCDTCDKAYLVGVDGKDVRK